jgi:hypothetical protein
LLFEILKYVQNQYDRLLNTGIPTFINCQKQTKPTTTTTTTTTTAAQ